MHVPSSDSGINNKSITVTGYPGDKPSGTMWSDSGTTYDVSTRTFKHNADTMGGQSGSPICFYSGSTYGYQSIGIHIAGANDDTYNVGRRITKTLFDWLVNQGYVTQ
ncbi:trypsin-like serine peptidase [Abyssisolibacter fermentans]|uniref:trypsin-like serine peptidase n=1 Tax=Abyssisolibacter fermentans TaxID=1766203 RepID=UPI00083015FA|nr:hypothetical protein [Abyssisolibacter fermentans]